MSRSKSFYVLYPANPDLRNLLNAMKLFADENQRTEAHLTVRGPYLKKLSTKDVERFSNIIRGEVIQLSAVDNFFSSNQNTVFYSCERSDHLKAIWKKITYSEFNPHITIYDGDDRQFAHELYNTLQNGFIPLKCKVSHLSWLEPKSNDKLKLFYLKSISEYNETLKEILNISKEEIDFKLLTSERRLFKISLIAQELYSKDFSS